MSNRAGACVETARRATRSRAGRIAAAACLLIALSSFIQLTTPAPAGAATYVKGSDWRHVAEVAGYMAGRTPSRPLVYLLGGSAARECIISERSWRRQIVAKGGPETLAFGLGATGQTYDDNLRLVRLLPDAPSIVIIGVIVGRYTRMGARTLPRVKPVISPYYPHRFRPGYILSDTQKSALITDWLRRRYPVFQDRFAYNNQQLDKLVALCIERGFHPVLLHLPLNLDIVRHRLDAPRRRYREACQRICQTYSIPWVNWLPDIPLESADFLDNWHLQTTGRVKWERRLAYLTVKLLKQYGMD